MITYRAWDSRKKKYLYPNKDKPLWSFLKDVHLEAISKKKTIILEEYFGRTDRLGKRIYVGDIVIIELFGHKRVGQVIYLENKSCYGILEPNTSNFLPFIDYTDDLLTVVTTIHELNNESTPCEL